MYSKRLGAATPLPLISFADNGSVFCSWSLLIKRDQWQLVLFIWQLSGRIRKKLHAVSTARVCLQKCPATCATISRVPCRYPVQRTRSMETCDTVTPVPYGC